jgi:DNA-binding MurR/RpiR family transcriptional regulator
VTVPPQIDQHRPIDVQRHIDEHRQSLSPAERRVAAVVADDPEAVAFGTVAGIARRAGTSGATVVRLATRLGYEGFVDLQGAVREELAHRLRPAAARIRHTPSSDAGDAVSRTLAVELANVVATLEAMEPETFTGAVLLLADPKRRVRILSGDASRGVAWLFASELGLLRPGVDLLPGSEVRLARELADVGPSDTVVAIDLARYDRSVVDAAARAADRGASLVALSDSALSPLATRAAAAFTVSADQAGPFDSHVGVLALTNALTTGVAERLRRSATRRLDGIEAAWREAGVLQDD